MPSGAERERRWAGAELARLRSGRARESKMVESQLRDFAKRPTKRASKRSKRGFRR